jgi:hypothetical protein
MQIEFLNHRLGRACISASAIYADAADQRNACLRRGFGDWVATGRDAPTRTANDPANRFEVISLNLLIDRAMIKNSEAGGYPTFGGVEAESTRLRSIKFAYKAM